jgi:VCBS repeat-containing protein
VADSYTLVHDSTLETTSAKGVLANDWDAQGNPMTATLVSGVQHGTLNLAADGTFVYTPATHYLGLDSFTYQVVEGINQSDPVVVTINVENTSPVALDGDYRVLQATILTVPTDGGVLSHAADHDGDALAAILLTSPLHGTLTLSADGAFVYTPLTSFQGTDTFTYKVSDGVAESDPATVSIQVYETVPQASDDTYTGHQGTLLSEDAVYGVLNNDTSAPGRTVTASLVSAPSYGQVTLNLDGSFAYTPNPGFVGSDFFSYQTSDGFAASNMALVWLDVQTSPPWQWKATNTSSTTRCLRSMPPRGCWPVPVIRMATL